MYRVAVFTILAVMAGAVVGNDFTCFPNRTIQFTNPDVGTYTNYRAFYTDISNNTVTCNASSHDNDTTVIFSCNSVEHNITVYFSDVNMTDGIIGGAGVGYTFFCAQLADSNITVYGNLTLVSVNNTFESASPSIDVTAEFYSDGEPVTTATVGQDLIFEITGPHPYTMLPLTCVAKGGSENKTIITNGCSLDDKLVSNFSFINESFGVVYDMTFHAFRFLGADDLMLECTVKICSTPDNCDINCDGKRRRRSRAVPSGNYADDENANIGFISKRLIIKDGVLGGSTRANGSLGMILPILFVFMKA